MEISGSSPKPTRRHVGSLANPLVALHFANSVQPMAQRQRKERWDRHEEVKHPSAAGRELPRNRFLRRRCCSVRSSRSREGLRSAQYQPKLVCSPFAFEELAHVASNVLQNSNRYGNSPAVPCLPLAKNSGLHGAA
jgi:hypothetical protein